MVGASNVAVARMIAHARHELGGPECAMQDDRAAEHRMHQPEIARPDVIERHGQREAVGRPHRAFRSPRCSADRICPPWLSITPFGRPVVPLV